MFELGIWLLFAATVLPLIFAAIALFQMGSQTPQTKQAHTSRLTSSLADKS